MHRKPLELYIHIPFCIKKCQYCDFLSFGIEAICFEDTKCCPSRKKPVPDAYVDALCYEIEWYGKQEVYRERPVVSVFFGGGTPSLLEEEQLMRIMSKLREYFQIQNDAEISLEANPGTVTLEKLKAFRTYGINRLSMGLQSTMQEELSILGRIHNYDTFLQGYHWAQEAGFENINIDLMMALPNQTEETYRKTLEQVISLQPKHISAYSLIIEPGTPFEIMEEKGLLKLPDEDSGRRMYHMTRELLDKAGYKRYEISNYAKEGYECRHNVGYWMRTDYLGFGLGAASLIGDVRFSNTEDMERYFEVGIGGDDWYETYEKLSVQSAMEEFMFLGLRMIQGVSEADFETQFGNSLTSVYGDIVKKHVTNNLLERINGRIHLTETGLDVANRVMSDFLL